MANIHDYLRWRGDLTFEERPFNDVDNLILSAFVYLDFTGIIPTQSQGGSITLREACHALLAKTGGDVTPWVRSLAKIDTPFVELVGDSRRFGDAQVGAYADVVDKRRDLQFAAMWVDLPHAGTYVAFRGTDTSLVGWRENFMISFRVTAAQQEAVKYLAHNIERTGESGEPIRVGGHSKGGNLAEYAAACCPKHLRGRIAQVYSNDGPGMAPEVMLHSPRMILGDRLRLIVPTFSVVGMLFARKNERRTYVASTAMGIEQHDITTWQVLPNGVEEEPELNPDCLGLNEAIASWASKIPLDERERVTHELFDALQAGGATTIEQIVESPEKVQQVLRALGATDDRTRRITKELVQRVASSGMDVVRNAASKTVEGAGRRLRGPKAKRAQSEKRG
ncbi:MAG: DUF2974 domain-containing protein [Coriobacteriales bacterium]|nr:DUF2974 domain-containing protein [Coriobacteriales bacterium]